MIGRPPAPSPQADQSQPCIWPCRRGTAMTCVTCASIRLFALDLTLRSCAGGKLLGWKPVSNSAPSSLVHKTLYKGFCFACSRGDCFMLWSVLVQLLCCYWIHLQMEDLKKQQASLEGMLLFFLFFELLELVELASSRDVVNH